MSDELDLKELREKCDGKNIWSDWVVLALLDRLERAEAAIGEIMKAPTHDYNHDWGVGEMGQGGMGGRYHAVT